MTDTKPERVCANCVFYSHTARCYGSCNAAEYLPPCLRSISTADRRVLDSSTCVLFRAREES